MKVEEINKHKGIALPMVLWFVAALSIIVAGISSYIKVDVRQTRADIDFSIFETEAQGAANLALSQLMNSQNAVDSVSQYSFESVQLMGENSYKVYIIPVNGLVNIGALEGDYLYNLLVKIGDVSDMEARGIVDAYSDWRDSILLYRSILLPSESISLSDLSPFSISWRFFE